MNPQRRLLFALARQDFTAAHRDEAEQACRWIDLDWDEVANTAAREGIAPIAGVNLAACDRLAANVPARVSGRFEQALFENAAFKAQRRAQLTELTADLDRRGYDVLLLKSAALELGGMYAEPWVTCARDLDIAIRWRGRGPERDRQRLERALYDRGVECDVAGHHDLSLNGIVDVSFDELWAGARRLAVDAPDGPDVFIPSPEHLLLTLCLNASRKRFFRLKALFDIAETATRAAIDWNRFAASARAWRAERTAFVALGAAAQTLGLPAAARGGAARLVSRTRAFALGSMVKLLRGSAPERRAPLVALQYAAFTSRQRWRSARFSAAHRPGDVAAAAGVEGLLPGE